MIYWVLFIATIALCLSGLSVFSVWQLAKYVTNSEQMAAQSIANVMRLVLHIGRETDTLRQPEGQDTIPPGTTVH